MVLKRILRILLVLTLLFTAAGGILAVLIIEKEARITATTEFTAGNIARVKELLSTNNPQTLTSGERYTVEVTENDLELTLNYFAGRSGIGAVEIDLAEGTIMLRASVILPDNPLGKVINLTSELDTSQAFPRIRRLTLGRMPVPAFLAQAAVRRTLKKVKNEDTGLGALHMVKECKTGKNTLTLTYEWSEMLANRVKASAVSENEQERWRLYYARLTELTAELKSKKTVSLVELLIPLTQMARDRSAGGSAGAGYRAENRAVLVVLASYVTGSRLTMLVPAAKTWPKAHRLTVTLADREDFPMHFIISAAMASSADSSFSDAVGLYKELSDFKQGSGFSFNDMAADKAGVRFAEEATGTETGGREIQQKILDGLAESDILPDLSDLPEFMNETEFKKKFGGVDQPEYIKMMADIDGRVEGLPLYR